MVAGDELEYGKCTSYHPVKPILHLPYLKGGQYRNTEFRDSLISRVLGGECDWLSHGYTEKPNRYRVFGKTDTDSDVGI